MKKRLSHTAFAKNVINNEDIRITDMEYMSIEDRTQEGYHIILLQRDDSEIKLKLSVDYINQEILVELNEYQQELIDTIEKFYTNKGYNLTIKQNLEL